MRALRNRRRINVAFIAILTALTSVFIAPPALAGRSDSARLKETKRQLRAARTRLAALKRTDADLMSTIRFVGHQLDSAKGLLSSAQSTLAGLELKIQASERKIAKLSAQRNARAAGLHKRVVALYMMGPGAEAEALLQSTSFQQYAEKSTAFDFVLRADKLNMEDLAALSDRTRRAQREMAKEAQLAQGWRYRVSERVSLVWDALQTHTAAEDALHARIKAYQDEVRALEREQQRIEDIIFSRGSIGHGKISLKGFIWPVKGHHITSPYGPRWGGFHTGMDIDCNTGDGTWAAKAGKVIAAEWGGGYGNMVIVDHGNGVSTLYAHHSALKVHEGQEVTRGQRIGSCGSTGNSTGSHLHFEVRINGKHTNPRPYLS